MLVMWQLQELPMEKRPQSFPAWSWQMQGSPVPLLATAAASSGFSTPNPANPRVMSTHPHPFPGHRLYFPPTAWWRLRRRLISNRRHLCRECVESVRWRFLPMTSSPLRTPPGYDHEFSRLWFLYLHFEGNSIPSRAVTPNSSKSFETLWLSGWPYYYSVNLSSEQCAGGRSHQTSKALQPFYCYPVDSELPSGRCITALWHL